MKKGIFVHSGNAPTDSGWANLRKDCDFAVVKCGSCAPDEAMERNLAGAKKHGFKTSILWYIDGRCDAKEQAITALATVKDVDPTAILWVDFERNGIYTPTYAQLKEFFGVFTAKFATPFGDIHQLGYMGRSCQKLDRVLCSSALDRVVAERKQPTQADRTIRRVERLGYLATSGRKRRLPLHNRILPRLVRAADYPRYRGRFYRH